ncbi:50S ribosomal protein L28 [Neolewinella antarctica]|uniref:Large ribosomal subunit protein bL28 n=1 Tax=Neolewinella antarctica TaxID=442734 RepID=A0ABX0XCE4_9BACT|nr:50S ribosomal protein L28 [Neolewinella antarctica]NJC26508.1 large subunit ribosomal protein L28 [Neolewinella antarctica]
MSKVCKLTGKKPISGNNVSHSNRKTKRRFIPNIQTKKFFVPETGEFVTLRISTSAMRTVNKLGVMAYVKKLEAKGIKTGVKFQKAL